MDTIDDRFQHTLHVLTMGWLNLQAKELSINMLSFAYHFSIQFRILSPSSDILPLKAGIKIGYLDLIAQELSIDLLNHSYPFHHLNLIFFFFLI